MVDLRSIVRMVKSPENPVKNTETTANKKDPPKQTSPKSDIRNYFTSTSNQTKSKTPPNKIHTITSNTQSSPKVSSVTPSNSSNIFGFSNPGGTAGKSEKPGRSSGVKGAVKNAGSSTFVITKKGSKSTTNSEKASTSTADVKPFSGTGWSLSDIGSSSRDNLSYSVVRDHWLKKFDNNSQAGTKRPSSTSSLPESSKAQKLCIDTDKVECPVCSKKFKPDDLNSHLDSCLEASSDVTCSVQIFSVDSDTCRATSTIDLTNDGDTENCPRCKKILSSQQYNLHVQECFSKLCDKKSELVPVTTQCLACGKKIVKTELDAHLEDCVSMCSVFDTSHVSIDDDNENCDNDKKNEEDSYNCPFCLKLVLGSQMQVHLDQCLTQEDSANNDGNDKEKSLLVESLCSDDYDMH